MKICETRGKNGLCNERIDLLKKIMSNIPDDDKLQDKSEQFKAISDPTRLKLLYLLKNDELCVCEIIAALQKPQSTISHHLNILKNAGLIKGRKEGVWIHYRLINPEIIELTEKILG